MVAGIRRPVPLEEMRTSFPAAFDQLENTVERLEHHYRDVQDIEFTVEQGRLYLLQTRSAKRTAAAAVKAAVAMVEEGLLSREDAIARIEPAQLDHLLHPMLDPTATYDVVARGLVASPGAASGLAVFDADSAETWAHGGKDVILVRWETSPDDIHGLIAAKGILTAHGGIASHAALVARGMGKPCVAGCGELTIDLERRVATVGGHEVAEGDVITVDGSSGVVILGAVELVPARINQDLEAILGWADDVRRLEVHANADTPADAVKAREFGAQGIGLCRTEHMFFGEERLPVVQEMILADDEAARRAALDRLLPFQQSDFEGIFEAMAGLPVTIRLLDPPLHEFLPSLDEAKDERVRDRIKALHEANPMLGTRGCRLGLQWPEIYEMQVRAIVRAALAVRDRTGAAPQVEIMHPLVGFAEELRRLRELTVVTAAAEGCDIPFLVGTMIELPRACVRADEIARHADFFSFGTNDLTQTALGFSRDDAEGKFLTHYLEDGVLAHDPFATLDQEGVGELMRIAVERGRSVNSTLHIGICGEHGGDPASVRFCHDIGLDYVSCSPYRVPVARLAAAQAVLAETRRRQLHRGGRLTRNGKHRCAAHGAAAQPIERVLCRRERKHFDDRLHGLRTNRLEQLVAVLSGQVRDRTNDALPHRAARRGRTGCRSCGFPRRPRCRPFALRASAAGTSAPTGAKMIAASSCSGGARRPARPLCAELAGKGLGRVVTRPREGEHAPAL